MVDDQLNIFFCIMFRYLESFSLNLNDILNSFIQIENKNIFSFQMMKIFDHFPRNISNYSVSLDYLSKICSLNFEKIIFKIIEMFKEIINSEIPSIFISIQNMSPNYKPDDPYHRQIFLNFMFFFLTDLLKKIILSYNINNFLINLI